MIRVLSFAILISCSFGEHFIEFMPHPNASMNSVIELVKDNLVLDAVGNEPVLVKIVNTDISYGYPNLIFHCNIKMLNPQFELKEAFFCKKNTIDSKEICISTKHNLEWKDNSFTLQSFSKLTGFSVVLDLDKNVHANQFIPVDGLYFCKLSSSVFSISSKIIEIQDYDAYSRGFKSTHQDFPTFLNHNLEDIDANQLPLYLNCDHNKQDAPKVLPQWVINEMPNPFKWHMCLDPSDYSDCHKKVLMNRQNVGTSLNDVFSYHQFLNGTIVLLEIRNTNISNFGIACTDNFNTGQLLVTYMKSSGGIQIKHTKRETDFLEIDAKFMTATNFSIREGEHKETPFIISVPYVTNNVDIWYTNWSSNGIKPFHDLKTTPHKLIFPPLIKKSHQGDYVLQVNNKDSIHQTKVISVKVLSLPFIKDRSIKTRINYVKKEPLILSVTYNHQVSQVRVEINGFILDVRSKYSVLKSTRELFNKFPRFTGLQFIIKMNKLNDEESKLDYIMFSRIPSERTQVPQSHSVAFVVSNSVGFNRYNYQINVLEKPIILTRPYNCGTICPTTEAHIFKCQVDTKYYANFGLGVKYQWQINGVDTTLINSVFKKNEFVTVTGDSLIIKATKTLDPEIETKINDILSMVKIACHIDLYETISNETHTIYNSKTDNSIRQALKIVVKFDSKELPASIFVYLVPSIVIFFFVVLMAVLTMRFRMKCAGKTAHVDKHEEILGDNINRHNEAFKRYVKGNMQVDNVYRN